MTYFAYGMSSMFYGLMTYHFLRRKEQRVQRMAGITMLVLLLQCCKDLLVLQTSWGSNRFADQLMTAIDTMILPFYVAILIELCRPGVLQLRTLLLHLIPFGVLLSVFAIRPVDLIFRILLGGAVAYGLFWTIWTLREIPRFHRRLKEQYSYDTPMQIHWLYAILASFLGIFLLWMMMQLWVQPRLLYLYLFSSLALWMATAHLLTFHKEAVLLFQQESQMEDLTEEDTATKSDYRLEDLFAQRQLHLNPHLSLNDVAEAIGTNRTYLSRHFNQTLHTTFFDFVNLLRVRHAQHLLQDSNQTIEAIATNSGFNSAGTFRRVFQRICGISPSDWRKQPVGERKNV